MEKFCHIYWESYKLALMGMVDGLMTLLRVVDIPNDEYKLIARWHDQIEHNVSNRKFTGLQALIHAFKNRIDVLMQLLHEYTAVTRYIGMLTEQMSLITEIYAKWVSDRCGLQTILEENVSANAYDPIAITRDHMWTHSEEFEDGHWGPHISFLDQLDAALTRALEEVKVLGRQLTINTNSPSSNKLSVNQIRFWQDTRDLEKFFVIRDQIISMHVDGSNKPELVRRTANLIHFLSYLVKFQGKLRTAEYYLHCEPNGTAFVFEFHEAECLCCKYQINHCWSQGPLCHAIGDCNLHYQLAECPSWDSRFQVQLWMMCRDMLADPVYDFFKTYSASCNSLMSLEQFELKIFSISNRFGFTDDTPIPFHFPEHPLCFRPVSFTYHFHSVPFMQVFEILEAEFEPYLEQIVVFFALLFSGHLSHARVQAHRMYSLKKAIVEFSQPLEIREDETPSLFVSYVTDYVFSQFRRGFSVDFDHLLLEAVKYAHGLPLALLTDDDILYQSVEQIKEHLKIGHSFDDGSDDDE